MSRHSLSGRPWRRVRAAVLASSNTCCLCGEAIDMRLRGTHPKGPTVHHRNPLAKGGARWEWSNLGPSHRLCNEQAGDKDTRLRTSEAW